MKQIGIGIAGLVFGVVLALLIVNSMAPKMMLIESESPYDFNTTVERFEKSVAQANWKIPAVHDLQATMHKFGHNVRAVKVFELCHPDHAVKILKEDEERIVSSMMPCRVAIYERADGKVYFSRMNSRLMAGMMGGIIDEVMAEAFKENEAIIKNSMK
ncbi:MAG: DUF302 domain-containing protein [Bacteroidales bacterium]|jgi:uncharacterized protein (DUF302 family)|nr:DUF302 domain-containing protein [Bacteroidales bacterium]HOI31499.1 DUF302 domain-containing protein [Bacteroidales bacterium]